MFKIAVFVSGGGSNFQTIIDNVKSGKLNCEIAVALGDRECFALERARKNAIDSYVVDRKSNCFCKEIDKILLDKNIDLIVLAGFLSILDGEFVEKWKDKIINIHPSLLPKYGGKGMYGLNVHKKVLENCEKISGCTVHFVNGKIDGGKILKQSIVEVKKGDTPEELQKRVLEQEHIILSQVIKELINNRLIDSK